ncbi:hypothetical protein [Haloimpatiens lingqiaonensis]|uniref:hypothetical protein n=1 Tax=Haloimpatiens lingqiaonensis TaxID=1380675 RepID=UPI0010FDEEF3|nr:hypothetical protein [Haloimpatiens lingqiaonensis]
MPEIRNIPGVYQVNSKRNREKLTFELGEKFLARIVDAGEEEIILKLLDGWKFTAKLKNPLDYVPNGLIKFQVEAFEDGNLILKLLQEQSLNKTQEDSVEEFLKNSNMNLNKDDSDILREMLKHNIPLTKENISYIKNIDNLMQKIHNEDYINNFIDKYLSSKGISLDSQEGSEIKNLLKEFFTSLEKLNLDDVLILYENNIEISKENIDGFINVFKGSKDIFTLLKSFEENIFEQEKFLKDAAHGNVKEQVKASYNENNYDYKNENSNGVNSQKLIQGNTDSSNGNNIKDNAAMTSAEINNKNNIENKNAQSKVESDISNKNIQNKTENTNENKSIQSNAENKAKEAMENINRDITREDLHKEVKNQLETKTNEMKNIIKDLMSNIIKEDSKAYHKVMEMLKENVNNFKIFNSLSNEYYYLDLPINIRDNNYPFKLVIKDGREKGKIIDTKNVKIATSIKTINMGVVDTFIRVDNAIMNVEIKCGKSWTKIMEKNKEKLLEMLCNSNYNIYVQVSEKEEEFNLSNCREFFGDSGLNKLNVKV